MWVTSLHQRVPSLRFIPDAASKPRIHSPSHAAKFGGSVIGRQNELSGWQFKVHSLRQLMHSDGGTRAISGFLFQVLVGGAFRAAGECHDLRQANSNDLDALIELARTADVIHEFADEDLMLRKHVTDPANSASGDATLVQVKFSFLGTAKPIGAAEMANIVKALATAARRSKNAGVNVTGFALVTNRKVSPGQPTLKNKLCGLIFRKLQKVEGAAMDVWHEHLNKFARRFGMRDDEIEAGRQRLLGLIFESATSGAAQGKITRDDLLRCLCGGTRARELRAKQQATGIQAKVKSFDADISRRPVRRERLASIDALCAGRAIVIFAGAGGSGKTAALFDWCEQLSIQASVTSDTPLVALRAARGLPQEWLADVVNEWNPALRPINANEAVERLQIAGGTTVPLVHLALDGADEYPDYPNLVCIQKLAEWFWREDQTPPTNTPPRARLAVTCRNAEAFSRDFLMLRRSGGTLGDGPKPVIIKFDRFSETELRELLRTNFPAFERSLLRDNVAGSALVDASTGDAFSITSIASDAPRHPLTDLLLDPVMWRSFCLVDDQTREKLVRGDRHLEGELARHFCDRFLEKARIRTTLSLKNLESALAAIAAQNINLGREFRSPGQWQQPAQDIAGLSLPEARCLFDEAASGGLVREEVGNRWDWRSDAVEGHFANLFTP